MLVLARALISWLLTLGWASLISLGALCLAFGNFVVAWQSFTAQGFEPLPLRRVPLLGAWAEGFGIGEAPLAALYALMLTLGMNLAIIATAKAVARALRLFFDRRQALRSNDAGLRASAPDYLDQTVHLCVWSAALLIASILIIRYDVAQFRFRYENLFTQVSDPIDITTWAPDAVARLGQFVATFIRTATWGYVGCVIALAVALEYALGRVGEQWHALHNAIDGAVSLDDQNGEQPAPEPAPLVRPLPDFESGGTLPISAVDSVGHIAPSPTSAPGVIDPEPVSPPPSFAPPPAQLARDERAFVDVIIGPGRTETFPLADVQADPDRFVRDGSGRVWFTRSYWSEVIGGDGHAEGAR